MSDTHPRRAQPPQSLHHVASSFWQLSIHVAWRSRNCSKDLEVTSPSISWLSACWTQHFWICYPGSHSWKRSIWSWFLAKKQTPVLFSVIQHCHQKDNTQKTVLLCWVALSPGCFQQHVCAAAGLLRVLATSLASASCTYSSPRLSLAWMMPNLFSFGSS